MLFLLHAKRCGTNSHGDGILGRSFRQGIDKGRSGFFHQTVNKVFVADPSLNCQPKNDRLEPFFQNNPAKIDKNDEMIRFRYFLSSGSTFLTVRASILMGYMGLLPNPLSADMFPMDVYGWQEKM